MLAVSETGSTNADLAQQARDGAPAGTVLTAHYQSAGRGRLGRAWSAPPGSAVAVSILLRPERDPARWTWLPLLAGLAVADSLRGLAGVPAVLKWPNDVLVDGAKICGVLAERVETSQGPACVLGMGVNVALRAEDLPVSTATSLAVLRPDTCFDRSQVIATVLATLALLYHRWAAELDEPLAAEYRRRCETIGRTVRVRAGDGSSVEGEAVAVDEQGRLRVRTSERVWTFAAGDVTHLR